MSVEITVSLISAAVAVASVYLSARAARGTAQLSYEFDLAKNRASKEQLVEDIMSRYREPLLRSAFDLQSRIYNIIKKRFLVRYGSEGTDHEQTYAHDNTLYLFAQYFGWVEILRRDVQFLDLGDVERNHLLVKRLEHIADMFATDRTIVEPAFRTFRGQQRALGELMIPADETQDDRRRVLCLGYAKFRARLLEDQWFAEWFEPLSKDVKVLTIDEAHAYERLTKLQHALVELIEFLDDPPRRFLREYCTKL